MLFTDTHCHIHEESYAESEQAYKRALTNGVHRIICVGTDIKSSLEAVAFARKHEQAWAIIGVHPHETTSQYSLLNILEQTLREGREKIVGIGEIGLDYYYTHSPRETQIAALETQLQIAVDNSLPLSFHVRDAFDDFWPIFHNFHGLRGVLHSFTDNMSNMEKGLENNLFIGINGIATLASDKQELYRKVPLENIVLETDAPFLTPKPHRGTINEPGLVTHIAQHMASLISCDIVTISQQTERNATILFF